MSNEIADEDDLFSIEAIKARSEKNKEHQIEMQKAGIIRRLFLEGRFKTTPELFEAKIKRFVSEYNEKPISSTIDSIRYDFCEKGINNLVDLRISQLGFFGTFGCIRFDQSDNESCYISIFAMPVFAIGGMNEKLVAYKGGLKVMKAFSKFAIYHLTPISKIHVENYNLQLPVKKGSPGRHHCEEDMWAYKEIHDNGKAEGVVFVEWQKKISEKNRNLADAKRQFYRIIKKGWLKDENDNFD